MSNSNTVTRPPLCDRLMDKMSNIDAGYFVVDESTIEINNKIRLTFTTKVTPKGQIWLTNKYYEWQKLAA